MARQDVSVRLPHGWDTSHFLSRHRDRKWLISWRAQTEQQVPSPGPSPQSQLPSQSQHLPSTVSRLTLGWRSISQTKVCMLHPHRQQQRDQVRCFPVDGADRVHLHVQWARPVYAAASPPMIHLCRDKGSESAFIACFQTGSEQVVCHIIRGSKFTP